jgi:hypothetical protein
LPATRVPQHQSDSTSLTAPAPPPPPQTHAVPSETSMGMDAPYRWRSNSQYSACGVPPVSTVDGASLHTTGLAMVTSGAPVMHVSLHLQPLPHVDVAASAAAAATRAMGKTRLEKWGRLLMAMEIRAALKYYHITAVSTTFPEPFKSNKVRSAIEAGGAAGHRPPTLSWGGGRSPRKSKSTCTSAAGDSCGCWHQA